MATLSNAEHSERTQRTLLCAARDLFTRQGYNGTSIDEITRRTDVTRGALYYHFTDKRGLFRAVLEELNAEGMQNIIEHIRAAEGDTWNRFVVEGCKAFVQDAKNPSVQRIVYIDGPAVLGSAVRKNAPGLAFLRDTLTQMVDQGLIRPLPVVPLSKIVWAVFFEAGLHIAQTDADTATQVEQETLAVLLDILSGLRVASP